LTIESRVVVLQSLTEGNILNAHTSQAINIGIIADGLDDYTTDGRGDIGSLVRVEALKAARKAFSMIASSKVENEGQVSPSWFEDIDTFSTIYAKVLRLSAEKLDRVRAEAQQTLALVCQNKEFVSPNPHPYIPKPNHPPQPTTALLPPSHLLLRLLHLAPRPPNPPLALPSPHPRPPPLAHLPPRRLRNLRRHRLRGSNPCQPRRPSWFLWARKSSDRDAEQPRGSKSVHLLGISGGREEEFGE
jgi:hypothetical protein